MIGRAVIPLTGSESRLGAVVPPHDCDCQGVAAGPVTELDDSPDGWRRTWHLAPDGAAVPKIRRSVSSAVRSGGFGGLADDVEAVVSELVTNALTRQAPPVTVVVAYLRPVGSLSGRLRVTVSDGDPEIPQLPKPGAGAFAQSFLDEPVDPDEPIDLDGLSEHGRGLLLVAALADDLGVQPEAYGKSIWVEMAAPGE